MRWLYAAPSSATGRDGLATACRRYLGPSPGSARSAASAPASAGQDHRRLAVTAASRHLAGAILDLLQNQYVEDLTAREISRRLGYSYTHFERVFRKEFKVSIHQQLLKVRLRRLLLLSQDLQAAAIYDARHLSEDLRYDRPGVRHSRC